MKSKYKNKKILVGELKFDSQKEADRYKNLLALQKLNLISSLERQKKFEIIPKIDNLKGSRAKYYICDFFYYDIENKKYVVEDVKSKYTSTLPLFRLKWQLMMYRYPDYLYRIFT